MGDAVVARLVGEVDLSNAEDLGIAIRSRVPNQARGLIVDLSELRYLDSSGLGLLFDLKRRLETRRQECRVVIPPESPVRQAIELVALDWGPPLDSSLDAALAELPGG